MASEGRGRLGDDTGATARFYEAVVNGQFAIP
jgi:hypothetical protein